MLSPLPRHSNWRSCIAHPSRYISLPRKGRRVGLCIVVFEASSAFTHVTACTLVLPPNFVARYIEGFSHFVTSVTAPITCRLEHFAGWAFHPLENAAFARRTPNAVFATVRKQTLRICENVALCEKSPCRVSQLEIPTTRNWLISLRNGLHESRGRLGE